MKLYIAGPLFNEMERSRNEEMALAIEAISIVTYLPQRDGGVFSQMLEKGMNITQVRQLIFKEDIEAIKTCDGILCLLDGRVPDEGMCIELGIAYALGKQCIGYRTDSRVSESEGMNIILEGCLEKVFTNKEDLLAFFANY
ncbi:MAG: nucleoside 2-deoxyribosyltransferase [Candidatus Pacebacteria bacterium]|nr:nucleoside 2-deoxyribosyltransferase [Candidatus Paceibacterota bacterium]